MYTVTVVCLWLMLSSALSQSLTPEQEDDLREFIQATMACRQNAALAVALVRDGETIFAEGFGFKDVDLALPMTASTRINIGSLTKAFTSSLIAHSVSQSLVTWDAPLRDILGPDFAMEGQFRSEEVNLRDVFAHKIGVPSYWGVSTAGLNFTKEELCMDRFEFFPTQYNFRSRYKYSNYPYVLAGYVQEVVTGSTYDDSVYSTLFGPIGMNSSRTAARMSAGEWEDTAYSYIFQDDQYVKNPEQEQLPFLEAISPAGGIFSTAEDMAKWMRFHLNNGQISSGEQIIPADDMEETHSPSYSKGRESPRRQQPRFPVDDTSHTKALGWDNGMYRGHEQYHHTGSYSSYNCRQVLLPDIHVGVWTCVNSPGDYRGSRAVHTVNLYALDLLMNEEPWLNTTTTCTYPDPWRSSEYDSDMDDEGARSRNVGLSQGRMQAPRLKPEFPTRVMEYADEDYVGDYTHLAFGTFHIHQNQSDLSLYYEFGLLLSGDVNPSQTPDMYHMTLNPPISYRMVFFPEYPDGFPLYFTRDSETGLVTSVEIPYLEFDLPPMFIKQ